MTAAFNQTKIYKNHERRELTVERVVAMSPKLAWEGWTNSEHVSRWWGPKRWTTTIHEMDVRPGGVWRYSLRPNDGVGDTAYCRAVYQEVIQPARLVYVDSFADKDWNIIQDSEMYTTILFEPLGADTSISIVTRFASARDLENAEAMGMIEGFTDAFDRLEKYLTNLGGYMNTIISKDGTTIAYETSGSGPAVILVSSANADHQDAKQLAEHLSSQYTVYNYDRRGRGQSSDTPPYAVQREIEDIDALITEAGGRAYVFGSSSGAVLALEAASRLGDKIAKLFMYEPPFIINDSRQPVPGDYVQQLNTRIEAGKRSEAVAYFLSTAIGIPGEFIAFMQADPSWQHMESLAHTLAYDGIIMGDTQSGQPLPADRWRVEVPTLVMTGESSEPYFQEAAQALVQLLPAAAHQVLPGQDHSAVMMASDILAERIIAFYQSKTLEKQS
ncbi:alpha/beta fold hydrolase [Paenibacillus sp. 1P07SE]|uniref:alpha/beta fold hydrolase n=1 Tax=Paenibacillus sp. 1P07SE TaxID=3132209 RepID=UPI0039A5555A